MISRHSGQDLVGATAGAGAGRMIALVIRNTAVAMITKSTTEPMNEPIVIAFTTSLPAASVVWDRTILASLQLPPGMARLMIGIRMSATRELTTFPTAPPMMTPTARARAFV